MRRQLGITALVLLALGLVAAAAETDVEDLLRRGNAAFARGDFEKAFQLYQQAEAATTDPGQVAFNEAAALYAQNKYEEAERRYWLCLGDAGTRIDRLLHRFPDRDLPAAVRTAAGPRLARALYNLGNCALQRSDGSQGDVLKEAVVLFEHCLRNCGEDASLRADARHNLELAKELLRRHPPKAEKEDQSSSEKEDDPDKENPGGNQGPNEQGPNQQRNGMQPTEQQPDPGTNPQGTDEMTPGRGNLATLPDSDQLVPLSSQEAAALLRQAVERILGERRAYQEQAVRSGGRDVLDW